jgi:ethanolamine transporter EutH
MLPCWPDCFVMHSVRLHWVSRFRFSCCSPSESTGFEVFGDQLTTYAVLGTAAAIAETLYYALVFKLSGLRPVFIGSLAMRLVGGLLAGATIVPLTALAALQFRRITARGRRHAI